MQKLVPSKRRLLVLLATLFCATGTLVASPSVAQADEPPIDICVHKTKGIFRSITTGTCLPNELAIGVSPIVHTDVRPKKMDAVFANRIKVAQLMGRKSGHTLRITSGWRSVAYQQKLFNRAIKRNGSVAAASKWVLPPEYSMHPWGLAVDINYGAGKKAGAAWLEANGYKFGLCRRYENEWWHFEPLVAPGQPCPALEAYPVVQ